MGLDRAINNRGPGPATRLHRAASGLATPVLAVPIATAVVRSPSIKRTVRQLLDRLASPGESGGDLQGFVGSDREPELEGGGVLAQERQPVVLRAQTRAAVALGVVDAQAVGGRSEFMAGVGVSPGRSRRR